MSNAKSIVLWGLLLAIACAAVPVQAAEKPHQAVSVVFAGDVMLDNGPGHAVVHGEDPFADFAPLFADADISVCNLECVVAEGGRQQRKPYTFKAPVESIPVLKRHFSAVCVANTPSGDFGKKAFQEQLDRLDKAQLPYFGGGRDRRQARRPLILDRRGLRVALLGYNDFPPRSFEAGPSTPGVAWLVEEECLAEIKTARKKDRADFVIPFLHWGREGRPCPLPWQRQLAHRMIDAGADAVVGAHAHATQTVDMYRGRPIVYGLGNFVFDYFPVDPPVFPGWVVKLTFSRSAGVGMETYVLEIDKAGIPHLVPEVKEEDSR